MRIVVSLAVKTDEGDEEKNKGEKRKRHENITASSAGIGKVIAPSLPQA
jgi:hypothetical protein